MWNIIPTLAKNVVLFIVIRLFHVLLVYISFVLVNNRQTAARRV